MVIDKSIFGIVANGKNVFILDLPDGTLNDIPEQQKKTNLHNNFNKSLRPSKCWSHWFKLISVSPRSEKVLLISNEFYCVLTFAQVLVEELVVVLAPWVLVEVMESWVWEDAEA